MVCIFCLRHETRIATESCTYGLKHELPEVFVPKAQEKKADPALCAKCGVHPKNPSSKTNGCAHEYA